MSILAWGIRSNDLDLKSSGSYSAVAMSFDLQGTDPIEPVPTFRYRTYPLRLYVGQNALANLRGEVDRAGARRAFVVCGQTVAHRTELLGHVKETLGDRYAGVFDGVKASSPLPSVEAGVAAARAAKADLIVGVGGGSSVVTARAIVILLAEEGTVHDLCTKYQRGRPPESPRLRAPKIPNIIVLTTPTTAMNRSGTAVMDVETQHRLELFDPKTRPSALIWDPIALMTAGPSLFLSASAAALSGVAIGLASPVPNPVAHGDRLQALRLLLDNMPRLDMGSDNPIVRMELVAAAFLSNRASDVENRGGEGRFGVIGALAHQLDTLYQECSHGAAYSIVTAPGLRFNRGHTMAGQARLAAALGVIGDGQTEQEMAVTAADKVEELYREVEMPLRLRDVGVPREGIFRIAQDAHEDFGLHRNARPIRDVDELVGLLKSVW